MIEMVPKVTLWGSVPLFIVDTGERVQISILKMDGTLKQVVYDACVPQSLQLGCEISLQGTFKTVV